MENIDLSWTGLQEKISKIRDSYPQNRQIWTTIHYAPITTKSIDKLISKGITLEVLENKFEKHEYGRYSSTSKKIFLEAGLDGYERDTTLFHELVHAWYGKDLYDNDIALFPDDNNAIAEWLARQLRSNHKLLRYAIMAFGLEPQIYDRASYMAFSQKTFD